MSDLRNLKDGEYKWMTWGETKLVRKLGFQLTIQRAKDQPEKGGCPCNFHTRVIDVNEATVYLGLNCSGSFLCLCLSQCVEQWSELEELGREVCEISLTVSVYECGCKDDGGPGRCYGFFFNPQRGVKVSQWCTTGQINRLSGCYGVMFGEIRVGRRRRCGAKLFCVQFSMIMLCLMEFIQLAPLEQKGLGGGGGGGGWGGFLVSSSFPHQEQYKITRK